MPNKHATGFSYYPLSFALPESAAQIIQGVEKKVAELKASGQLPPGLEEQYDLQLEALRDPAVPDCQFICGHGLKPLFSINSSILPWNAT